MPDIAFPALSQRTREAACRNASKRWFSCAYDTKCRTSNLQTPTGSHWFLSHQGHHLHSGVEDFRDCWIVHTIRCWHFTRTDKDWPNRRHCCDIKRAGKWSWSSSTHQPSKTRYYWKRKSCTICKSEYLQGPWIVVWYQIPAKQSMMMMITVSTDGKKLCSLMNVNG